VNAGGVVDRGSRLLTCSVCTASHDQEYETRSEWDGNEYVFERVVVSDRGWIDDLVSGPGGTPRRYCGVECYLRDAGEGS
jgi:hypothetical protein